MAATTTFGNADVMRANLLKAIKTYDAQPQITFYEDLAGNIIGTEQLFELAAQVSGISLPTITPEYGVVPTTSMTQIARKQYNYQKRTLQFRWSDESFINDNYGIVKGYGSLIAGVFAQAKDIAAAVYLNGATNTALISTPFAQPLASTAHPLETGTDSNTFVTQQTLGVIALEDATTALLNQQAYKNYPMPKFGPFQLEVANRNNHLSARLISSDKQPQSFVNDFNSVAGKATGAGRQAGIIVKRIVSPYFTNPEWWALRSTENAKHNRFMLSRYGFKLMPVVYDEDNDSWKVTAKEAYLFDVFDYRGAFYSTPS